MLLFVFFLVAKECGPISNHLFFSVLKVVLEKSVHSITAISFFLYFCCITILQIFLLLVPGYPKFFTSQSNVTPNAAGQAYLLDLGGIPS